MSPHGTRVLAIDAGHTRIKFALCNACPNELPVIISETAADEVASIPWEELQGWMPQGQPCLGILTGSNGDRVAEIESRWTSTFFNPIQVLQKQHVPIENSTKYPTKVGIDRLLTGVAVNVLRQDNQSGIIVDTGTAVTVDYINPQGVFCGGAILPGVLLSAKALHEYTTSLPHYDAKQLLVQTPDPVGDETETAIASGLFWGHLGAVKELISRLQQRATKDGSDSPFLVITGGAATMLVPYFTQENYLPHLSLQGLAITALHLESTGG